MYAVWLADDVNGSPDTRFVKSFAQPYVRTDNKLVANDWTDLTNGSIANPLNIDQNGNPVLATGGISANVRSHVRTNGAKDVGEANDCGNWTSTSGFWRPRSD